VFQPKRDEVWPIWRTKDVTKFPEINYTVLSGYYFIDIHMILKKIKISEICGHI
jgi:hypothetical protein